MSNKLFIIGIDKYVNLKALKSSVRDVLDLKNLLQEEYNFDEVYELLDENATNKKIQDALNLYARTTSINDNLVIFYSGHGDYDEKQDRGFWVPVDGDKHYTSWIGNDTLLGFLSRIPCKHIFLISDSCFSNSILITAHAKSATDYLKHQSRWALTSAYSEAMDADEESNTLFAETILNYLENAEGNVRTSELIEAVKAVFLSNVLQVPQGHPLMLSSHRGGEFVFERKKDIDKRTLKGYANFKKILQLYKRSSQFTELLCLEDKAKKIGCQLYQEVDNVIKKATFYLYLYEGINQTQTLKYLQDTHPQIFRDKNLLVFLPREKNVQNHESRKRNISEKFKPVNAFYIDDFIKEQCTPKIFQEDESTFLSIKNFVLPIFSEIDLSEIDDYLINWLENNSEPILILKGTGGIGKTTFAQYIADKAQSKYSNTSILFIDSVLIKDLLLKSKHDGDFRIYHFYEAFFEITDSSSEKLSEDVFNINIDAGNLLLIIDGLDEVISKIPNFRVHTFLKSIDESSSAIGGGKAIITCRTHFWNTIGFPAEKFKVLELEPFNREQTKLFFERSFGSDEAKIKRAIKLAEDFRYPKSENTNIYDPYVLDIIRSLIASETTTIDTDLSIFSSKLLKNSIKNDYIIYRVCDRERKRIGQIKVDDQISFFIHLAVQKRGIIKIENLSYNLDEALHKHVDSTNVEAFKSHPFLKISDSFITFRYDFLGDLFRSIYISLYFDHVTGVADINSFFLDVVSENCWMGSQINQDIVSRVVRWDENDVLNIYSLIEQIHSIQELSTLPLHKRRKVIANIFNLAISVNHRFLGNDIYKNTELLKNLFLNDTNKIEKLSIINIGTDSNIRFDFSGLDIHEAYIDNFGLFWDCNADHTTRFIKCHFIHLKLNKKNQNISKAQLIDCTYDNEMEASLKRIELTDVNRIEQSKSFLNDFFHLFFSNGRLGRQWEDKVIQPRYYGINKYKHEYKKTIRALKKIELLSATEEKEGTKFSIPDKHKEDVIRFIKDGTISNVINSAIKELS